MERILCKAHIGTIDHLELATCIDQALKERKNIFLFFLLMLFIATNVKDFNIISLGNCILINNPFLEYVFVCT